MGIFCSPCCCVCGKSPMKRLDNPGWLQDFCPEHQPEDYEQYLWGVRVYGGEYKISKESKVYYGAYEKIT